MKILDKYILKSFLKPFIATFLIILFVLVMQALWLAFDKIAGKGVNIYFILKFLYYISLSASIQALPIAILLSSIMAMGNLSEHFEFAAAKSAAIPLPRLLRPLIILTLVLSILNFFLSNNVYPYAKFKAKNLRLNLQKKKPALALVPESFNTEIPGYQIKFDEKYGEKKNLLKNVLIYDLSSKKGNKKVITAKRGKITTEEGSKYMTLVLYNGKYYEEHIPKKKVYTSLNNMPSSQASFNEYIINIDISSFTDDVGDDKKLKGNFDMLTISQLRDTIPNLKINYDKYLSNRSNVLESSMILKDFHFSADSLYTNKLNLDILENFDLVNKQNVLNNSTSSAERSLQIFKGALKNVKLERKRLNLYDVEKYNRVAISLSCLLFFFIGAPLGSIIRKGGFGLPMVLAIAIYVIFFFSNTLSRNLAEGSSVTAITGGWLATGVMIPICYYLTRKATKDMGVFNIDVFLQPVSNFFKKFRFSKKE